jgi:cytochrome c oxidase subunit 2
MGGRVVAMEPKEFANWLANSGQSSGPMTMAQAGEKVYNRVACNNCHAAENTLRAPSLYGILGKKRMFSDGSSASADETYLRESILRPHNRLTSGYDRSMPAYEGQLTEEEVLQLLAYIKELGSGKTPTVTGLSSQKTAPTESTKTGASDSFSVGALQYNTERSDTTPTSRGNTPGVGAYAAEGQSR